jgi:tRNA modification GTPase
VLADDTIAAISTPPGEGAIAVIRLTGPDAITLARGIFRGRTTSLTARTLHFGEFAENGERLDEGLLAVFRAPRSYTGENMAEIHCHGGILVTARLLEALLRAGARAAEPGEFTRRAFLNGKMDLTQAEAVMDVIRASTPRALRAASEQLEGRLGAEIEKIRAALLAVVAHLEAYIDFPEEGISPHAGAALLADIQSVSTRVDALLGTAREGRILREGVRLVLCGAPNAGKSSLLNRLLGFERAIVSETAGTTRDTIEEFASLRGLSFRITDTAGLRETTDAVEHEGVERARKAIEAADVVVHVIDITATDATSIAAGEIVALNKSDLLENSEIENRKSKIENSLPVSSLTGDGLPALVDAIVTAARGAAPSDAPTLAAINARHQACLDHARRFLEQAATDLKNGADPELVAVPLRQALDAVSEIVGVTDIEDILGQIFSTFCIGK